MTKQPRGHPRLNLNGYCGARVTQKFKWTQCKNQVVAHARPWMTTGTIKTDPRTSAVYFRIAGSPIITAGRNLRYARASSSHVSFIENQREKTTRDGTTSSRSDIGDEVRRRVDIRTGFLRSADHRFSVAAAGSRRRNDMDLHAGSSAKNPPRWMSFREVRRREIFATAGGSRVQNAHKRALRFATAGVVSLDEKPRWNERFAARTHTGRGFVFDAETSRLAAGPGASIPKITFLGVPGVRIDYNVAST